MSLDITTAQYFAAHAPAVPYWFTPNMREKPVIRGRVQWNFNSDQETEWLKKYDGENDVWYDPELTVPNEFKAKVNGWIANRSEEVDDHLKWEEEHKIAKFMQWPLYYGYSMAAAFTHPTEKYWQPK